MRFSTPEYKKLTQFHLSSDEKTIAGYIRKSCLQEPVNFTTNSKFSQDDKRYLVGQLLKIGNNLNQITKKVNDNFLKDDELLPELKLIKEQLMLISSLLD